MTRAGGIVSVTTISSTQLAASVALAAAANTPCEAAAYTRRAPRLRHASAVRAIVVAAADQIVDDDRHLAVDIADERIAAHFASRCGISPRMRRRPAGRAPRPGVAGTPRRA